MYIKKILDRELLLTVVVMFICMVLFLFFPANSIYQKIISGIVFFIAVPMLYTKIILKKKIKSFFNIDFSKRDKNEIVVILMLLAIVLLTFFFIAKYTSFKDDYFLKDSVLVKKYWGFMAYEFLIANVFIITYEVFFRGFVMSYFLDKVGSWSVFIQFIFFLMLLILMAGKLPADFIYYIVVAPIAGMVAYRTKSIVYSYAFSFLSIFIGDIIFLTFSR